ncbi:MAG: hypothetical protein LBU04_05010 [Christensenellaceae bacterium]|nr:hypothetical protein [Christensenellaceae bacterium]
MKKFLLFMTGVLIGISLVFGSVALALYVVTSGVTMGSIEDLMTPNAENKLTDSQRAVTLSDLILPAGKIFSKGIDDMTVSEFEEALGTPALSTLLSNALGADINLIRSGKLTEILMNTLNTATLGPILKQYGIVIPLDIPLFHDDSFLYGPLLSQFSTFPSLPLDRFVTVIYDADATEEILASVSILQKIGKTPISELSSSIDPLIKTMLVRDLITDSDPDSLVSKFADVEIGNLGNRINNITITEVMTVDEESHIVLRKLANGQYTGGVEGQPAKVSELGNLIQGVVETCTIGDLLGEATPNESRLLRSLRDVPLSSTELNTKIKNFTLEDLFDDNANGILGLAPRDTKLDDLPKTISSSVTETSVYRLEKLGVYDFSATTLPSDPYALSFFYNSTPSDTMSRYLSVINGSPSALIGSFHKVYGKITSSFFSDNAVKPGDTLVLIGDASFDNEVENEPFYIPCAVNIRLYGDDSSNWPYSSTGGLNLGSTPHALTLDPDGVFFIAGVDDDHQNSGYSYIDDRYGTIILNSCSTENAFASNDRFKFIENGVTKYAPYICVRSQSGNYNNSDLLTQN